MDLKATFREASESRIEFLKMVFPIENPSLAYQITKSGQLMVAPYFITTISGEATKRRLDENNKYQRITLKEDNSNRAEFDAFEGDVGVRINGAVYKQNEPAKLVIFDLFKVMVQYFGAPLQVAEFTQRKAARIEITTHAQNLTRSKKGKQYLSPFLFTQWGVEEIPQERLEEIQLLMKENSLTEKSW